MSCTKRFKWLAVFDDPVAEQIPMTATVLYEEKESYE